MNRLFQKKDRLISLVAGFCLLLIVLIWITVVQRLDIDHNKIIATAVQRNSNLTVALEQYAIRTLSSADAMLQLVRSRYQKKDGRADFEDVLKKEFTNLNFFSGVTIIDEKGKPVVSNLRYVSDTLPNFSDRPYFRFHANNSSDQLHMSEPIISRRLGKAVIVLSRRINNADGSFGGIITVQIEPSTFTQFYASANLRKYDLISLISPQGITYARRTGPTESYGEDISASPLFSHVAEKPVGTYFAKDAIRNIRTYFSYRKLEDYPIIATVGSSEADVLTEYRERALRHYVFGAVITLLLLLFTILIRFVLIQRRESLKRILGSEARYRSIFENSLDAILLLQPDGRIEAMNDAARDVFRIPAEKPIPDFFQQLYISSDPGIRLPLDSSAYESLKEEVQFTCTSMQFTGEMTISSYKDSTSKDHLVIIISDITERKQMEERLLTDQKTYQRELTRQIILAQEREREVIGHDLHDNVNQILSTVKLYLEMALKTPEKNEELILNSIHHILACISEVRNLSRELSAPTLDNHSLIESIKALLKTVESSSGLQIRFNHEGYHTPVVKDQRLAIYRILQEQLNNIIKHADAKEVSINLSQGEGMTSLVITDNGKGFDTDTRRNGIGLNNILSRCKIFGGEMLIDSAEGKGCRLQIRLPVKEEAGIPQ
jgi:PAS domain S-box-containing protein